MTTKTDNQQEQKAVVAPVNLDTFDWNAYENDLGVYNAPKEEIEAKYDQTLSKVQVGEVVEGTVISLNKREVVVNIGYKSEGIIPVSEFRYNPELAVGEKVEVYVESARTKKASWSSHIKKPVSSARGIVSTRPWRKTRLSRVTSSAAPKAV